MPTRVDVPGMGIVEFPDGMTDAQISAVIQKNTTPPPSRMATFGNALMKGAAGFGDMIGNGLVNTANLGIAAAGTTGRLLGAKASDMPDLIPADALSGYKKIGESTGLIKQEREPQDMTGRLIDVTGQVIGGGGINPVAAGRSLARGAVLPVVRDLAAAAAGGIGSGLASEAVRNVNTGNETVDRLIKVLAPVAGGAVPSAVLASRGTAGDRASAALNGVTEEQIRQAKAIQEKARIAGTPVTGYEAVQGVTGINPKMQTQQRVTEQSDAGGRLITPIMQQRPANNAAYFERVAGGISPAEKYPDVLAGLLKKSAEDSITSAQKDRTAAVSPSYQQQRNSDRGVLALQDAIPQISARLENRLASRADARQQTGQIIGRENEMRIGAENAIPVPGQPRFPSRYTLQNERAVEAAKAIPDFDAVARQRAAQVAEAERTLSVAQDALASKNLPYITNKVRGFLGTLDSDIRLAGPTTEGKILKAFRDEIAPEGKPIILPSQLESVYRANRDKLNPGVNATSAERTQAGILQAHVSKLDKLIQEVSPAIREGRSKYAEISREKIDPMMASQVGKLTRSDEFRQQANTLLPENPLDVTPAVIERTVKTLSAQDPDITRRFIAQYLRGTFNESSGGGVSNNAFGGYQFAKKVADNPGQQANLIKAIEASGAKPAAIQDALEVFRAQGTRPPVNSATSANLSESAAMGSKMADILMRPFKTVGGAVDTWRNGMATKELAKALSDPNSVQRLQELARSNGTYNPLTQQMLAQMLLTSRQNSAPQTAGQ